MSTAILSDLDGVLVDSQESIMRAWRWWSERHRLSIERVEHGRPSGEMIARLAPDLDAAAESLLLDEHQSRDTEGVIPLPGAAELLAGPGPVAVVTSGTVPLATARLRACGLPIPAVLVTPERIARGKPDPEGYLLAASELGVQPSDCVVLEDAPAGIAAGRAAGMRVVGIVTTHAPEELLAADELAASVGEWLASRRATQLGS